MTKKDVISILVVLSLVIASGTGCAGKAKPVYETAQSEQPYGYEGMPAGYRQGPDNLTADYYLPEISEPDLVMDSEAASAYRIGSGDVLTINVYQLTDLEKETVLNLQVDPSGQIYMPLLNHVDAVGKTTDELKNHLTTMLARDYIRDPRVAVSVKSYASKQILVLGNVTRPGPMALESNQASLLDVIGRAGGIRYGAGPNVEILRGAYTQDTAKNTKTSGSVTFSGEKMLQNRELVPISQLFAEAGELLNPIIYPGDIVSVPSDSDGFVYLLGEFENPGAKINRKPMRLLQAVSVGGGTTKIAKQKDCKIIRRTPEGAEKVIYVNLEDIRSGDQEDIILACNDTIVIPVDPVKKFFDDLDKLLIRGVRTGVDVTYDAGEKWGFPGNGL